MVNTETKVRKAGEKWVTVTQGMRGWFAVIVWMNGKDIPGTVFVEPWDSDSLSFRTQSEAVVRGMVLAADEGLEFSI